LVSPATHPGALVEVEAGVAHVLVEGQSVEFRLAPPPTVEEAARHAALAGDPGAAGLIAPMPGRVVAVRVEEGATVHAHEPIVIIEAMKMEHAVTAPTDGVLARLAVRVGTQVRRGDVLGEVRGQSSAAAEARP
jgi:biotin carboxyl carrier protein